jgi:hypothetical protein
MSPTGTIEVPSTATPGAAAILVGSAASGQVAAVELLIVDQ